MRRIEEIAPTFMAAPREVKNIIYEMYENDQHLYFIKAKRMVKIGITRDPQRRLNNLQVGSPAKLELICVIPYGGTYFEKALHKQFKDLHSHGEWFSYGEPIKEFIRGINEITEKVGLRWNIKKNELQEDSNPTPVSLPPNLLRSLQRINGKTPRNNIRSWKTGSTQQALPLETPIEQP